MVKVLKIEKCI